MSVEGTIAILTFNGDEYLDALLSAVYAQKTKKSFEVLIIDSGSSDRTLEIVKKYPKVRLKCIPNKEFAHGRTRNLAVEEANGEFVIFLTQDAIPAHEEWFDYMLEPFTISPKVGCVFGKQIPRQHCFVSLKREIVSVFCSFGDDGSISLQRRTSLTTNLGITNSFLSDVNSAVRKSIHTKVPFQNIHYSEDQALGLDMLAAGYLKAYAPLGSVYHSHDYPLRKYYRRKFDEYVGLRKSTGYIAQASGKELVLGSAKATLQDWVFLLRDKEFGSLEKLHDFLLSPAYNVALRLAIRKAARSLTEEAINKHSLEFEVRSKAEDNSNKASQ